jgi:RNA-directed DNA polymerase
MPNPSLLRALARSFLNGEVRVDKIVERAKSTLGRPWRWLRPLAERYVEAVEGRTRPRHRDAVRFLRSDAGFQRALSKYGDEVSIEHWLSDPPQMQPVRVAEAWNVPVIETAGDLAAWLRLDPADLDWFADLKGLGYKANRAPLRHYHYRLLTKRSGGVRLIEIPKSRLMALQRQILAYILDRVPAHPAAHGFVKGRSIKSFVAPHTGQHVVLRMDLQDFFPSFSGARIQAFFRTLGYPEPVADLLGGICTNATPRDAWTADTPQQTRSLYARPHLPQGASTSPSLANACMYRVDCRLAGLANAAGARYTRYADDLAFSGSELFDRCVNRFATHVAVFLHEENLAIHHRKTRVMRQGVRQHLAGLVANRHANIIRGDFDRLKATLTNCIRMGPESQNREGHSDYHAHLQGKVSFVEMINPAKGQRLRAILERIEWR